MRDFHIRWKLLCLVDEREALLYVQLCLFMRRMYHLRFVTYGELACSGNRGSNRSSLECTADMQ